MTHEPSESVNRVTAIIIWTLSLALLLYVFGELAIGAMYWLNGDGNGVNLIREDLKTFITFILGVFAGVVQARVIGTAARLGAAATGGDVTGVTIEAKE